jgi:hypothetical protein
MQEDSIEPEEEVMHLTVVRVLAKVLLFAITAVATHLVMSFSQTLMHYKLGHYPIGGTFFRNHINFHHTYYSKDHLVSQTYLGDEGNNTPFFFIPVLLVGAGPGFNALHGLDASRSYTSFITGMRTAISR